MARPIKGRLFTRGKNKYYHIQFYVNGKEIKRVLRDENGKNITTKAKAQKAADILLAPYLAKDDVQRRQQAEAALHSAQEKARQLELLQNAIKISEAHNLAMHKPRRRKIGPKSIKAKETHWSDFVAYMASEFSDILTLDKVTKSHAEKYTQYLIKNGKYVKAKSFKRKKKTCTFDLKSTVLSPRTINAYLISINEIFNLLADDGGYEKSPFANIPKQKLIQDKREAFTLDELKKIREDGDDFIVSLFSVGLCTGLREADICLLEWKEVDMVNKVIRRKTRKTGVIVEIPLMPQLMQFLQLQQPKVEGSKYVLPDHAEMYLKNPSGITWRVKKKLDELGIESTRVPEGRARAVSIKDVHSLRHSFCYYAGISGIPLSVVQDIVGHMTEDMTKHYTAHVTLNDKRKELDKASDIFDVMGDQSNKQLPEATALDEPERYQLLEIVNAMSIENVKQVLEYIKDSNKY